MCRGSVATSTGMGMVPRRIKGLCVLWAQQSKPDFKYTGSSKVAERRFDAVTIQRLVPVTKIKENRQGSMDLGMVGRVCALAFQALPWLVWQSIAAIPPPRGRCQRRFPTEKSANPFYGRYFSRVPCSMARFLCSFLSQGLPGFSIGKLTKTGSPQLKPYLNASNTVDQTGGFFWE